MGSLLQALIAAGPKDQFLLDLCDTAECEDEPDEPTSPPFYDFEAVLSQEFINEWEPKLKDNNIVVEWCSL